MDLFEKFQNEIKEDVKIDQLNLLDKQLMLPALKHKWVARLIENRRLKNELERKKKILREEVFETLLKGGVPPGIPKASLQTKIDSSDVICKINQEIDNVSLTIEYLEKVEKIFSSMTFDIKNITEISKLEMS
jgi:hypothetical protein